MQRCLMLGSGLRTPFRAVWTDQSESEANTQWTTLDNNPDAHPDVLFDLNRIERTDWPSRLFRRNKLPFVDNTFDEIHAYEVMEHYGSQGNYVGFFAGMRELWRILKPYGRLCGCSPALNSYAVWSDPGHRRSVNQYAMAYLGREQYEQLGKTASSDYRRFVDPHWWSFNYQITENGMTFQFALIKLPIGAGAVSA